MSFTQSKSNYCNAYFIPILDVLEIDHESRILEFIASRTHITIYGTHQRLERILRLKHTQLFPKFFRFPEAQD